MLKTTLALLTLTLAACAQASEPDVLSSFDDLLSGGSRGRSALAALDKTWTESYVPMLVETIRLAGDEEIVGEVVDLLRRRTKQPLGGHVSAWFEWIWERRIVPHPRYADFKSRLYRQVDPRFAKYFSSKRETTIRLDEVRWGGVAQDGIPPLRNPTMIAGKDADWLDDENVVFGIEINGDVRAYPKRILAWHEMFTDEVGDIHVTGVY